MDPVDLSSGVVHFGNTCPGSLMQRLRIEERGQVQKIKKLQTAFATCFGDWWCWIGSKDPKQVAQFIKAIRALEELDIYNYEANIDVLWPAIFHQAASLESLKIHSPPQFVRDPSAIWTVDAVKRVAEGLPQLKRLEMDIDAETGKTAIKAIVRGSVLDEVAKMESLEFLCVSVILLDGKSTFAGDNSPTVFGSAMPPPHATVCAALARKIFNKFYEKNPGAAMEEVEICLTRRAYQDRGQFYTKKYSYRALKREVRETPKKNVGAKEKTPVKAVAKDKGNGKGKGKPDKGEAPPPPTRRSPNRRPDVKVTAEGPWVMYRPNWSENVEKHLRKLI